MAAPSGTNYPGGLDTTTSIGTSVSTGDTITAPYQDIQSSAILAIETALAANPQGSDASVAAALTARARKTDVQNQTVNYADDSGVANAYVVTLTPALASYAEGQGVVFKALNANTGASTLNVSGLGTKPIVKNGATALASGDIAASQIVSVVYDSASFQLVSPTSNALTTPVSAANGGTGQTTYSKGDLLVGNATSGLDRLAVGSNTQVFTADSTQTDGVKWAAVTPTPGFSVASKSANYTTLATDNLIRTTGGTSGITITLISGASSGTLQGVKKVDSGAGAVTVTASGTDTIDGQTSIVLRSYGSGFWCMSDGSGHWSMLETSPVTKTWTPKNLSGLLVWLDANQITGVANGATFTTWNGSSGNGHNFTTQSAQFAPTYRTNVNNGLPAVDCSVTSKAGMANTSLTMTSCAIFAVMSNWSTGAPSGWANAGGTVGVFQNSPISSYGWWAYNGTADCYTCTYGTAANAFQSALSIYAMNYSGVWSTSDWSYNGQSVKLIGGSTAASFNSVGIASQTLNGIIGCTANGSYPSNTKISELIMCTPFLNPLDYQHCLEYLCDKYGIPSLHLPSF